MLTLSALTLFLSAHLLFWVQLMVAKMILPLLGGSPAVWNTCQFFFQGTLLIGYAYSHFTSSHWLPRRQAIFHCLLLFGPLLFLPITIGSNATFLTTSSDAHPIFPLLALLTVAVGCPFFVVSTTAPLVQKWFSQSGHPQSQDPYFLYTASNLGSICGLVSYPLLIEPYFSLPHQSQFWAIGYGLLICLTLACAVLSWALALPNSSLGFPPAATPTKVEITQPTNKEKAQWVLLSFIPSSLMLGVTTYITTDLAAIPLLWAIPLGIYLLSFIVTFAPKSRLPYGSFVIILPLLFTGLIFLVILQALRPLWLFLPLHLGGLLVAACTFHGELARRRPQIGASGGNLTGFYLWMAFGGLLGGLFNAIVSPLIFPTLLEYPLIMLLSILIIPELSTDNPNHSDPTLQTNRRLSLGLLFGGFLVGFTPQTFLPNLIGIVLAIMLLFAIYRIYNIKLHRLIYGIILILLLAQFSLADLAGLIAANRSFFGINRVVLDREEGYHILMHGTTMHGKQSLDIKRRYIPLTYFYPTGPLGQLFTYLNSHTPPSRVAVLGLGIGTLAAYSLPQQQWTFYEIDPLVADIAQNSDYFTFLQNAKAEFSVILGDGRLQLAKAENNSYDLIIMDAFTSDAIPVHLVTREAIQLYLTKLTPTGIIAINISNRYINLEPVLGAIARDLGLSTLSQQQLEINPEEKALGKSPSQWVLFSRNPDIFRNLTTQWHPITHIAAKAWTDDFSNIWTTIRFFPPR
ncbi:MAG TPA: fused MFS/spermidine synthase [Oscillatoriaceae cyanobacterium M33_DOE_052]|nr:fused MFS/spermidine synthase [Oscillatoriaceae cyanobacterium M33_DOE_052]